MRALKDIDIAFVCTNLPYTMPPGEAADGIRAFLAPRSSTPTTTEVRTLPYLPMR